MNVVAYDYSGYGASTGKPSEPNVYADISAVYEHLRAGGLDTERHLVLYGQSVGSAPTLWRLSKLCMRARAAISVSDGSVWRRTGAQSAAESASPAYFSTTLHLQSLG